MKIKVYYRREKNDYEGNGYYYGLWWYPGSDGRLMKFEKPLNQGDSRLCQFDINEDSNIVGFFVRRCKLDERGERVKRWGEADKDIQEQRFIRIPPKFSGKEINVHLSEENPEFFYDENELNEHKEDVEKLPIKLLESKKSELEGYNSRNTRNARDCNTRFIIIRHAERHWDPKQAEELGITKVGHEQAKKLAIRLQNIEIDVILTSTMVRAMKTAEYTANMKGIKLITSDELREVGEYVVKWECTMSYLPPEERYLSDEHIKLLQKELDRLNSFFDKVASENKGKTICIFTHGGVIRLMKYLANFSAQLNSKDFKTMRWSDYTGVTVIDKDSRSGKYNLKLENDSLHIIKFLENELSKQKLLEDVTVERIKAIKRNFSLLNVSM